MDTRGRPGDRQAGGPERWPITAPVGTSTSVGDAADLVDLTPVQTRRLLTGSTALIVTLVASLGILAAISLLPSDQEPDSSPGPSAAALTSAAIAPTASPKATPTPRPSRPAPTTRPTPVPTPPPGPGEWLAITTDFAGTFDDMWAFGDRFVVRVMSDEEQDQPEWLFYTSRTARTWEPFAAPRAIEFFHGDVVVDGRLWLLATVTGVVGSSLELVSTDAIGNWESLGPAEGLEDVAVFELTRFSGGWALSGFVEQTGGGPGGMVLRTSADGIHWSAPKLPERDGEPSFQHLQTLGNKVVVWGSLFLGDTWTMNAWTSRDGVTWTVSDISRSDADEGTNAMRCNPTLCVAMGTRTRGSITGAAESQAIAWVSTNGRAWTDVPVETATDRQASALEPFVATATGFIGFAADTGDAWLSGDGVAWRRVAVLPPGRTEYPVGIVVNGDTVLALAYRGDGGFGGWLGDLEDMELEAK